MEEHVHHRISYIAAVLFILVLVCFVVAGYFLAPNNQQAEVSIDTETTIQDTASSSNDTEKTPAWRRITSAANHVSIEVPTDWNTHDQGHGFGTAAPGEDGVASPGFGVRESTSSMDGSEFIDGTSGVFEKLQAAPDGSTYGSDTVWTKIHNTQVDGRPAILFHSQTPPDIATEPWNEDITWVRSGNINWYITVDFKSAHQEIFDRILSSIKLLEQSVDVAP